MAETCKHFAAGKVAILRRHLLRRIAHWHRLCRAASLAGRARRTNSAERRKWGAACQARYPAHQQPCQLPSKLQEMVLKVA